MGISWAIYLSVYLPMHYDRTCQLGALNQYVRPAKDSGLVGLIIGDCQERGLDEWRRGVGTNMPRGLPRG